MATRLDDPHPVREKRIVIPTEPKKEEENFGSANPWKEDQL